MYRFLFVALVLFCTSVSASAAQYFVTEKEAQGGEIDEFLTKVDTFRKGRVTVVLPRVCISSCTLYTLLLPYDLVCARPNTALIFHKFVRMSARTVGTDGKPTSYWIDPPTKEDIRRTWWAYPSAIRAALPRGLPERGEEVSIPASRLGIPTC